MTMPTTFYAIVIDRARGPEVLAAHNARATAGAGQVLIRVTAAGVNRHDINLLTAGAHHYGTPVPVPGL